MLSLKKALENKLKAAKKIAILGVGSDLRGDDAAGVLVAAHLNRHRPKAKPSLKYRVFIGATAPENFTGQIKKFKPTHLIVIDSADFSKQPGMVKIIEVEELSGVSFCTHRLPLKIMIDYLAHAINCNAVVIGIQPKEVNFGSQMSKQVDKAVEQISGILKAILKG